MGENNNVDLVQGYFFFVLLPKQLMNNAKVINKTRTLGVNVAPIASLCILQRYAQFLVVLEGHTK